jgi:hypothetical protein
MVRLAFVTLRNNLMVLSLRAMLVQFAILMLIAAFCFAGFLYALWTQVHFFRLFINRSTYFLSQTRKDPCTVSECKQLRFGVESELMNKQFQCWVIPIFGDPSVG